MTRRDRIYDLLDEWTQRYRRGETLTAEELAPNEPELHHTLARRIRRRVEALNQLDTLAPSSDEAVDYRPPRLDGYQIQERVGRTNGCDVYQAVQIGTGRMVAVKLLLGGRNAGPETIARFRLEAKAQEMVRHPNVVRILDRGKSADGPFLALEWMHGGDLQSRAERGRPKLAEAIRWAIGICRGVTAVHAYGLLHRDIKPGNILFDHHGTPKIGDFGLVRQGLISAGLTLPGQPLGTPAYMPPEQAQGQLSRMGPSSDVYGIGAVLFFLLAGRPPYYPERIEDLMHEIVTAPVPRPSEFAAGVPTQLDVICRRCLMKEPWMRYPSVSALQSDLQRAYLVYAQP